MLDVGTASLFDVRLQIATNVPVPYLCGWHGTVGLGRGPIERTVFHIFGCHGEGMNNRWWGMGTRPHGVQAPPLTPPTIHPVEQMRKKV